ncbi:hypothetical protein AB9F35_36250, partial [Rhizobium leguminosarum]
ASHYLLARCDLLQESVLDFIVSSDWPFDLVRDIAARQKVVRSTHVVRQSAKTRLQPASAGDTVEALEKLIARQQIRHHR